MSWALKQKVSSERGRGVKSRDHRPGPYVKIIGAVYGGGGGVYGINAWQAVEVMEGLSGANMTKVRGLLRTLLHHVSVMALLTSCDIYLEPAYEQC